MLELGICQDDIAGLQKKLIHTQEEDTSKYKTVEEYLRDTENHILSELKYSSDDDLHTQVIIPNNMNPEHLQYLRVALEDY